MKHVISIFACSALFILTVTGTAHAASPARVNLGTAARFAVLAGTGVSNEPTTFIAGDVGVTPGGRSSLTGFNISGSKEVNGYLFAADDVTPSTLATLQQAKSDLTAAYDDAAHRAPSGTISGNIGGQTFEPGVYQSTGPIQLSSGDVTLNGKGDQNAVWIFQIPGAFTVSSNRSVALTGGAQAQNIFWQIGDSVTFGSGIIFNGNIVAKESIALGAATKLNGRALALNGSVALKYNDIQTPEEPTAIPTAAATIVAPTITPTPATQTAVPTPQNQSNDAQLAMLLAMLADLQKQVAAQPEGTPAPVVTPAAPTKPTAPTIVVNETKALQIFLNTHGFQIAATGPGSPGNETTKFGALTRKALCAFQVNEGIVKSASDRSCGVHGPKTKAKIKALSI